MTDVFFFIFQLYFPTMKTKMMLIMVTFCVLIVFHENMSVECLSEHLMRLLKKNRYVKCCIAIKCLNLKICDVTSKIPFKCKCNPHVKVD